jgi:hypothetical protein
MDIDLLHKAADNEDNSHILNLTKDIITNAKLDIMDDLPLSDEQKLEFMEKLDDYVYIDEIHEIRHGTYVRWLNLEDNNDITLAKGGIFCEVRFTDYGMAIQCKNFRNRYYEIRMDNIILFRKLTPQEKVLMCALTYLNK